MQRRSGAVQGGEGVARRRRKKKAAVIVLSDEESAPEPEPELQPAAERPPPKNLLDMPNELIAKIAADLDVAFALHSLNKHLYEILHPLCWRKMSIWHESHDFRMASLANKRLRLFLNELTYCPLSPPSYLGVAVFPLFSNLTCLGIHRLAENTAEDFVLPKYITDALPELPALRSLGFKGYRDLQDHSFALVQLPRLLEFYTNISNSRSLFLGSPPLKVFHSAAHQVGVDGVEGSFSTLVELRLGGPCHVEFLKHLADKISLGELACEANETEIPLRTLKLSGIPFGPSAAFPEPGGKPAFMRLLDAFRRTKLETVVFNDAAHFRGYSVNDFNFSLPSVRSMKLYAGFHTYPFRFASNDPTKAILFAAFLDCFPNLEQLILGPWSPDEPPEYLNGLDTRWLSISSRTLKALLDIVEGRKIVHVKLVWETEVTSSSFHLTRASKKEGFRMEVVSPM